MEAWLDTPSVWAGQQLRLGLLTRKGLDLTSANLGELAHRSPPDDIIDAAACAWTAQRVLVGQHARLPANPPPEPGEMVTSRITY